MVSGLRDRRCLVTGAARGIGREIARRLTDDGMRVTVLDVDPSVRDVADELGAHGLVVDLADAGTARAAVEASIDADPYWLLVNNAGVFARSPVLETPLDEWNRIQQVNAASMLLMMQAAVPPMLTGGGGRVVNMASMAAKRGTAGEAAYAASKAAVVALTRAAAIEWGGHGVTVNALCPGYVLTEMGADARSDHDVAAWTALSPLGRLAEPGDVAGLVAFLASDDGAYLTGQAINVSGGMCTW